MTNSVTLPEIQAAGHTSPDELVTTNLLPIRQDGEEQARLETIQTRLELAKQQRRERDMVQAEKNLLALVQPEVPDDFRRSALLELALLAQENGQLVRAQQVYAQYLKQFREDPSVPEILLRQGIIYRDMGTPVLALAKFYAVMSSALRLKLDRLAYYQRLVLQAQTEIADTYYLDGKFLEAADFFSRLLRLDDPNLNREQILYKLVRSYSSAGRYTEALAQAQLFVARHQQSDSLAEVRFVLAGALKHLGRKREAMQEVLGLIQSQKAMADQNQGTWEHWQQRAGNELGNQLYLEGDYLDALEIYLRLANLNTAANWRLPALYQAGLIYEHLKQPQKASEIYGRILEGSKEVAGNSTNASVSTVLEMARWRKERLVWQTEAEMANQQINCSPGPISNSQ